MGASVKEVGEKRQEGKWLNENEQV